MSARAVRLSLIAALILAAPGVGPYSAFASSLPLGFSGPSPTPKPAVGAATPNDPAVGGAPILAPGISGQGALPELPLAAIPEQAAESSVVAPVVGLAGTVGAAVPPVGTPALAASAQGPTPTALSPLQTPADPRSRASAPSAAFLADPASVTLPAGKADMLSPGELREAGARSMDAILGTRSAAQSEMSESADSSWVIAAGLDPDHFVVGGTKGRLEPLPLVLEGGHEEPPNPAPSVEPVSGPLRRSWRALSALTRVFPDRERNRTYWRFLSGQTLLSAGNAFSNAALPDFLGGPGKKVMDNRAVHWGSQALSSLISGPIVDRFSKRSVMFWTYLGRVLLLASISALWFSGHYAFARFQAIIFSLGFLQNMGATAAGVASMRIQGPDKAHYNRANTVSNVAVDLASVVGSLLAGSFIGFMDQRLGTAVGSALSYAVCALLVLGAAFSLLSWRTPQDELMRMRGQLADALKSSPVFGRRVRNVSSKVIDDKTVLFVEVSGDPQNLPDLPSEFAGYEVRAKAVPHPIREIIKGFKLNWENPFLRWTLLLGTFEIMSGEALTFTLPSIIETLPDATVPWLADIPLIGPFFAGLVATKSGAFGLYLAASSLGMTASSLAMLKLRGDSESETTRRDSRKGRMSRLNALEKQGLVTSILYGIGSLAYAGVFFMPTLWYSVGMMLLSALLQAPAQVVWTSVHQGVLQDKYLNHAGKVNSARGFYQLLCQVTGLLIFSWVMPILPMTVALWVVGALLGMIALIHMVEPFIVFPLERKASR